ncbi:MAG: RIP metalloprotease RseP [Caldisericia bacterium]
MEIILTILNIIYAILILGVLVLVHELGHFIAARSIGLPVITFSVGMGPAVKKWKWARFGDTEFRLSAIPFGGYCMVSGEEEDVTEGDTFWGKTPWQRIWYTSAGVLFNFILAIIVFIGVFATVGPSYPVNETNQIKFAYPQMPADKAGIKDADRILMVGGNYIFSYEQMATTVNANAGEELDFLVGSRITEKTEVRVSADDIVTINLDNEMMISELELGEDTTRAFIVEIDGKIYPLEKLVSVNGEKIPRLDDDLKSIDWEKVDSIFADSDELNLVFSESIETRDVKITPKESIQQKADGTEQTVGIVGVNPWSVRVRVGILDALKLAFVGFWNLMLALWSFIVGLFKGRTDGVGGPVAIFKMTSTMVRYGLADVLEFAAILSVNLGFINLLPFPGLDGGHILTGLFEGITGVKIKRNVLNVVNYIGFLLLMGLMVLIVIRDVLNLF